MARSRNHYTKFDLVINTSIDLSLYSAQYLLGTIASYTVQSVKPDLLKRYQAALSIIDGENIIKSDALGVLSDAVAESCGELVPKDVVFAFAKKVLSSPLIKGIPLHAYSQLEDGDDLDDFGERFKKLTSAQVDAQFPELNLLYQAVIRNTEKTAEEERARREKQDAEYKKRQERQAAIDAKNAKANMLNMIAELAKSGYTVLPPNGKAGKLQFAELATRTIGSSVKKEPKTSSSVMINPQGPGKTKSKTEVSTRRPTGVGKKSK